MALTTAQQAQIRLYLGYPSLFRYKNPRLEGAITGNLDADAETLITTALSNLATVESKILTASIPNAGLKKLDEIEFFRGVQLMEIRKVGQMYVTRISIILGVPIYSDVFGNAGYLGDTYSAGTLGGNRGSGNMFPLG